MTLHKQIKENLKTQIKPWIAKNPKDGLYYHIDRLLKCPMSKGFKTKAKAIEDFYGFKAAVMCCELQTIKNINAM